MKKKINIEAYEPIPYSCYFILFGIFICIIYLVVLRNRVEEFFESPPAPVTIKNDSNPSEVEKIWEGTFGDHKHLSVWQRKNKTGEDLYKMGQFALLSDNTMEGLPDEIIEAIPILNMLAKGGKYPISYVKIWSSDMASTKPEKDMSIWQAVAPDGYTALGDIIVPSLSAPARNKMVCLPNDMLSDNEQIKDNVHKLEGEFPMSIWTIGNYGAFMGSQNINGPEMRKDEIKDIKDESINIGETDPAEVYGSLKIEMKTY